MGAPRQPITTGSGLDKIAAASEAGSKAPSAPGSRRSMPPSTRSEATKPPSTRQFAQAYQAFYDVDNLNDAAMDKVRQIKNGTLPKATSTAQPSNHRLSTGLRQDPNFRANMARFHGSDTCEEDEFYKNYRAFYGGQTPSVN